MNTLPPPLRGAPTWEGDAFSRPLKIAVIREELVALTKDPLIAVVLNQLVYWTQRVKDFDLFLEEERRVNPECNVSSRHGWLYKTANELIEETMLHISHPTMRKYLKFLIEKGWLEERSNTVYKWNKTTQYRVNLRKLQEDLFVRGYALQGFSFPFSTEDPPCEKDEVLSNVKNLQSDVKNFPSNERNLHSNVKNLHSYTYTETTPKTTNREHTPGPLRGSAREFSKFDFQSLTVSEKMIEVWTAHVSQSVFHVTEERQRQLNSLLNTFFQNEIVQWESFCKRVKDSPFLMGEGTRRWHVTLDWVLSEGNLLKILEGNFDDPDFLTREKAEELKQYDMDQTKEVLDSIEDPLWKNWCAQLIHSPSFQGPISLGDLRTISKARFVEMENNRLAWIESADTHTLSRIEDLRLELLAIIQRTFPNARNIRTRLSEDIHSINSTPLYSSTNNPTPQGEIHA